MALVQVPATLTYLPPGLGGYTGMGTTGDDGSYDSFDFGTGATTLGSDSMNDFLNTPTYTPSYTPTPLPFTSGGGSGAGSAGSGIDASILHAGTAIAGQIANNMSIPAGYSQSTVCDAHGNCQTSMSRQAQGVPLGASSASLAASGLGSPMMMLLLAGVALFAFMKK